MAARHNNTGSGTLTTPKQAVYWLTPSAHKNDGTCRELLTLLTPFSIGMVTSDDRGSYTREVPKEKYLTGKIFTQRIERNNLTLHTRIKRLARKTICFSRSMEIHEKVIGSFIEKYMFY
ncbi:IS1 transposase [Serratia ficaria]|nr:IS1 transposase [Serratia ficaria]CAI1093408.1 IS1 transposase [Serratia ficaria]CAI2031235.1 IS1 transposase [Serratia ficaria]CAI2438030.1 IS1 transposase [Serratia ficaria]CAI2468173.1 IS1 transposase [Serratia ficaria]